MKHITIDIDDETALLIAKLAEWWGLPTIRHNAAVVNRCVERIYTWEKTRRELVEFDRLQQSEPDPLE